MVPTRGAAPRFPGPQPSALADRRSRTNSAFQDNRRVDTAEGPASGGNWSGFEFRLLWAWCRMPANAEVGCTLTGWFYKALRLSTLACVASRCLIRSASELHCLHSSCAMFFWWVRWELVCRDRS